MLNVSSITRNALFLLLTATCFKANSNEPKAFLDRYCATCHNRETEAGGLSFESFDFDFHELTKFNRSVKILDRVTHGEMPPHDETQPSASEKQAFLESMDRALHAADVKRRQHSGRVRLRRMTRIEFENSLKDLLKLPYLDIVTILPADGRVAGYDKIAAGLDVSPAHLSAYGEAIEKAMDLAIATRSTPPPVYRGRVYPAGLFKFGGNLIEGQFALLRDKVPDPSFPIRGGFEERKGYVGAEGPDIEERRQLLEAVKAAKSESAVGLLNPNLAGYEAAMNVAPIYAGYYRLKVSLWGFQWQEGIAAASEAPQAAALRAHQEGKQQEGGRLLSLLTAPSLRSNEVEIKTWLDAHESIVFDPVSIPWNGLRIGQVAGRAAKHIGPGVAIDWFEIEGPINESWPPQSHTSLFGSFPIKPLVDGSNVTLPRRPQVRGLGGYLPNFYSDIPPHERKPVLETVQSDNPIEDARALLADFVPRAFRRDVTPGEIEPYLRLLQSRLDANDCFEDAMRRVYVAVLTSPEFLFHSADRTLTKLQASNNEQFILASRLSFWLCNGPP